ncbi:MAG: acyltransferase [Enterobacteriaceae bacterium]
MTNIITLLTLPVTAFLITFVTIFWSIPITLAGVVKLLLPFPPLWRKISTFADLMMWCWCQSLVLVLKCSPQLSWEVQGLDKLSKQSWYLLISNHKSWCDIIVLCVLLRNHIPMNKFFLKQQLAWVPFVGLACWALDMPFMKRYSRAFLIKHPHLRGKDIETTRRSCEKFRQHPTTIVNFVEGTRFTPEKRVKTHSPWQHLLTPKAAGIAFTLNALGKQFDQVINVTLYYPDNPHLPFKALLSGRLKRIVIRIETIPITDEIRGDYFSDKAFKRQFQLWLTDLWTQKDKQLSELEHQYRP